MSSTATSRAGQLVESLRTSLPARRLASAHLSDTTEPSSARNRARLRPCRLRLGPKQSVDAVAPAIIDGRAACREYPRPRLARSPVVDALAPPSPIGWFPDTAAPRRRTARRDDQSFCSTFPGGWFQMGSDEGQEDERPVHRVWVDGFEMGVFPVTRREYAAFLAATGHEPPRDWLLAVFAGADLPVVGASWHDAVAYCEWSQCRLPTEAEWERAARGGRDAERYPASETIPPWIPKGGKGPLAAPWPVTLGEPNSSACPASRRIFTSGAPTGTMPGSTARLPSAIQPVPWKAGGGSSRADRGVMRSRSAARPRAASSTRRSATPTTAFVSPGAARLRAMLRLRSPKQTMVEQAEAIASAVRTPAAAPDRRRLGARPAAWTASKDVDSKSTGSRRTTCAAARNLRPGQHRR